MYIPLITPRDPRGGGGGGSGGGRGGRGGNRNSNKGGSNTSKSGTVPKGTPFSGREYGGGTRDNIYGTRIYGSGYPTAYGTSPYERGFPYRFWPITWGNNSHTSTSSDNSVILITNTEYGRPNNGSRPGGALTYIHFESPKASSPTTLRFLADNKTTVQILGEIQDSCSLLYSPYTSSLKPINYTGSRNNEWPLPEQAIQYYRASTAVLTLDGYNNSAALVPSSSVSDSILPLTVDSELIDCLNYTIGDTLPLSDSSVPKISRPHSCLLLFMLILLCCGL